VWFSFENQKICISPPHVPIYTVHKILTILKHGPYLKIAKSDFEGLRIMGESDLGESPCIPAPTVPRATAQKTGRNRYNAPIITHTILYYYCRRRWIA